MTPRPHDENAPGEDGPHGPGSADRAPAGAAGQGEVEENGGQAVDRGAPPALATPPGGSAAPGGVSPRPAAAGATGTVSRTRVSAAWTAVGAGLVFLVLVVVFILENLQEVRVTFFGAHWTIPLGIDLLLAAVLGGLVVLLVGMARVLQLRMAARRHTRAHHGPRPATAAPDGGTGPAPAGPQAGEPTPPGPGAPRP